MILFVGAHSVCSLGLIAIMTQYLKAWRKIIFYHPPVSLTPGTAQLFLLFRTTTINVIDTQKLNFTLPATRTFWRTAAVLHEAKNLFIPIIFSTPRVYFFLIL